MRACVRGFHRVRVLGSSHAWTLLSSFSGWCLPPRHASTTSVIGCVSLVPQVRRTQVWDVVPTNKSKLIAFCFGAMVLERVPRSHIRTAGVCTTSEGSNVPDIELLVIQQWLASTDSCRQTSCVGPRACRPVSNCSGPCVEESCSSVWMGSLSGRLSPHEMRSVIS